MKIKLLFLGIMFPLGLLAQVGINTDNPQAMLDVNGSVRVGTRAFENYQAKKLLGVDEHGMIIELEMDDNIYIEGSTVKSENRQEGILNYPTIGVPILNDALGIVWPGGAGGRSVIRTNSLLPWNTWSGIDMSLYATPMDAHGATIVIYSTTGSVRLLHNSPLSLFGNRFALAGGNDVTIARYEMIKLVYDGIIQKWLVLGKQ